MPRVRKTADVVERKRSRKPVGRVSKPGVQVPSVRPNAGRRDRATPAPATTREPIAPAGLILEGETGDAAQNIGPAAGLTSILSPESLAAAGALDSGSAQAANVPQNESSSAAGDSAPADPEPQGPTIEDCRTEARMWLNTLDTLAQQLAKEKAPATVAAFHQTEIRHAIGDALGDVLHFYGLTGLEIAAHPLGRLAVAMIPLAVAGFADWRNHRAATVAAVAAAPAPAAPMRSPVAEAIAPANDLANRA